MAKKKTTSFDWSVAGLNSWRTLYQIVLGAVTVAVVDETVGITIDWQALVPAASVVVALVDNYRRQRKEQRVEAKAKELKKASKSK